MVCQANYDRLRLKVDKVEAITRLEECGSAQQDDGANKTRGHSGCRSTAGSGWSGGRVLVALVPSVLGLILLVVQVLLRLIQLCTGKQHWYE